MSLLAYFFLGLGWSWVGEFVGFIIIFSRFPTQQNSGIQSNTQTVFIPVTVFFLSRNHKKRFVLLSCDGAAAAAAAAAAAEAAAAAHQPEIRKCDVRNCEIAAPYTCVASPAKHKLNSNQ